MKEELQKLIDKWQGKPTPAFMSKEYIERRFDRIRYINLRRQMNTLQAKIGVPDEIIRNEKGQFVRFVPPPIQKEMEDILLK
jgi:hypothetical protein